MSDPAGILLTPLARIATAGGDVMHALKRTDPGFADFGEAYFSWVERHRVKAWKRHLRMTLNLVVPVGRVRFVVCLPGPAAGFRVEEIGEGRYQRLTLPPGLWFGFQGTGAPANLVLNLADLMHDPAEVERRDPDEIPFDWRLQ